MILHPKKLFLIDGLGALLSAFLLGFVLVRFDTVFGLPRHVLYTLSAIACLLALYSLATFFLIKTVREFHLKIIGWANLGYCGLTLALIFYFYPEITGVGLIYFLGEMSIIVTLATLELRFSQQR